MLVLSRKPGEKILVECPSGDVIELSVVRIGPNVVRIGVEAPRSYNIVRSELKQERSVRDGNEKVPIREYYQG